MLPDEVYWIIAMLMQPRGHYLKRFLGIAMFLKGFNV